jgi:membrane-bound ClpP family serine protease
MSVPLQGLLLAAGWAGIILEFLRPGLGIPAAVGGVLVLFSLSRLWPEHVTTIVMVSVPFAIACVWLLGIAIRARRNKLSPE